MPRIRTHTRTVTSAVFEDFEVELMHQPNSDDDVLTHVSEDGNKVVVAYLVHDDDAYHMNPMENCDAQGDIYTYSSPYSYACDSKITDNNSEFYGALGLNSYGEVDIDHEFTADEPWIDYNGIQQTRTTLRDLAADQILREFPDNDELKEKWVEYTDIGEDSLVEGKVYEIDLKELRRDLVDPNGCFWEEVDKLARELYPQHWQAIAGPYAVPISYFAERGGVMINVTDWDGDPNDLPDGVWVADKDAIENLEGYTGDALREQARKYAESIVKEYASWAEGDVYGCVVETFEYCPEGDRWDQIEETSRRGFIGREYAEEALKSEFFDPEVKALTVPA